MADQGIGRAMKRWVLLAVVYVLPKAQPLWPGMIVRCEQPSPQSISGIPLVVPTNRCNDSGTCPCHWECEFGTVNEMYIEDSNLKVRATGCAVDSKPQNTQFDSPYLYKSL